MYPGTAVAGSLWCYSSHASLGCWDSCPGLKVRIPQPLTEAKNTAPRPRVSLDPWPLELLGLLPTSPAALRALPVPQEGL